MYAHFFKRFFDFWLALLALIVLSPLLIALSVIGAIAMKGSPFFTQLRPGRIDKKTGQEHIFRLIKFRTMSNEKDKNGNLLPDEARLNRYGRFLRGSSLDELPELFNILIGDMAIVGPRPQLVRDMVFMTPEQRRRHTVRPGLTGLAQVSGRNALAWDNKLTIDLVYIQKITLRNDLKIIIKTFHTVFASEGITEDGMATATDYGDYLLQTGQISQAEYDEKHIEAEVLIEQ